MKLVLVLGHPAAGKTSTCEELAAHPLISHFSLGNALREIKNSPDHPLQEIVQHHLDRNELMPIEIIDPIIEKAFEKAEAEKATILLMDGYPRDLPQANALFDQHRPSLMLNLWCGEGDGAERYLERAREPQDDKTRFRTRYYAFVNKFIILYNSLSIRFGKIHRIETQWRTQQQVAEVVKELFVAEGLLEPDIPQSTEDEDEDEE